MTPLRIVLFVDSLRDGGADRQMVALATSFAAEGHDVTLAAGVAASCYTAELPASVTIVQFGGRSLPRLVAGLARVLRRCRPQLVISTKERSNTAAPLARLVAGCDAPLVLRLATHLSRAGMNRRRFRYRLIPLAARLTCPLAQHVVAISAGVARDAERVLRRPPGTIGVIYNPVDVERITREAAAEVLHPWLAGTAGVPVVLGAGRLTPQKDFATLIRAFALLRARRAARLIILGDGEERARLETLARDLAPEDVDMPGFCRTPAAFMARAQLFVLSSAWEGFGNVVTEALAAGVPVIATDCESGPREILAHGQYGRLVPVGDAAALAAAMDAALDAPASARSLRRRAGEFSPRHCASRYLSLARVVP